MPRPIPQPQHAENANPRDSLSLAAIVDALPAAVYTTDSQGRLTHFNSAAAHLAGRTPEIGTDRWCVSWKIYDVDGRPMAHEDCPMAVALKEGRAVRGEEIIVEQPSGKRARVAPYPTPLRDAVGRIIGAVNMLVDITDRRQADEAKSLLAAIVSASDDAIIGKALNGVILSWNRAAERLFGYSEREAVGQPIELIIPPERQAEERSIRARLQRGERIEHFETTRIAKGGRRIDVSLTISPVCNRHDEIVAASTIARDISESRRAAELLRASEERHRQLIEMLPIAVYQCNAPNGEIAFYNEEAARLWGRIPLPGDTDERFCGSYKLFLPDGTFVPHDVCPMALALAEGRVYRNEEVVIERPDGSRVTVLVNIDPIRDPTGRVIAAVNAFHDISPMKAAEQALQQSQASMANELVATRVLQEVSVRMVQQDNANALYEEVLESAIAIMGSDMATMQMVDERNGGMRVLAARGFSGELGEDFTDRSDTRSVSRIALRRGHRIVVPNVDACDFRASSEALDVERTLRIKAMQATPLICRSGRHLGVISTYWRSCHEPSEKRLRLLDVLARQAADLIERAQLERRKDEFLATLAHELRNPLAPLRSSLEILERTADPQMQAKTRAMMTRQVDHIVRLVDDLLDVARITKGKLELKRETSELTDVVQSAVDGVADLVAEMNHELVVTLPSSPLKLYADNMRLSQVLTNLLSNAAKYTPPAGRIELVAESRPGGIAFTVRDSGVGIPPDALESVFEMFSQLDNSASIRHGGLGIGLSLVKSLVELHGGWIKARSNGPGTGAEFELWLPVLAKGSLTTSQQRGAVASTNVAKRILVVDDNLDAAQSLGTLLEMLGNDVRLTFEGEEALSVAQEFQPQVVLLDIGLPTIDGYEVARRLRATASAPMIIVALTGWGQESDRSRAIDAGFDHHVTKPATLSVLEEMLSLTRVA